MTVEIICGDAREVLARFPDGHFHCCVTSPPYWGLRDYGLEPLVWGGLLECEHEWKEPIAGKSQSGSLDGSTLDGAPPGQERRPQWTSTFCRRCGAWRGTLGLEPTPELYVEHLVGVLREVRRVLRDDGTLWLNMGDGYASGGRADFGPPIGAIQQTHLAIKSTPRAPQPNGLKPKDLLMIPARVALALQADGWWLRSDIIWSKPNPMPESVTDRPTTAHEHVFLLAKAERYFYDQEAVRERLMESTLDRGYTAARLGDNGPVKDDGQDSGKRQVLSKGVHIPAGRNHRTVWTIPTQPFGLEMCGPCKLVYTPAQYHRLKGGSNPRCTHKITEDNECSGTRWLAQDGGAVCVTCETFYTAKQLERLPKAAKCRRCESEDWLSHFAVFPEKLVEPCILAGTSEHGCCPECGAPWVRVKTASQGDAFKQGAVYRTGRPDGADRRNIRGGQKEWDSYTAPTTIGWRPGCKHGHEPIPCRVLDPFAGSGTVGVVAERLGRHSVLVDAKPEYCELAQHRTAQRGLMVAPA